MEERVGLRLFEFEPDKWDSPNLDPTLLPFPECILHESTNYPIAAHFVTLVGGNDDNFVHLSICSSDHCHHRALQGRLGRLGPSINDVQPKHARICFAFLNTSKSQARM